MQRDWQERFSGIDRLYGRGALARLAASHVTVVGIGGVGSWAVEALARSGVGALTLVDADELCVSNTNRQLPALDGQYGRMKIEAMAERCRAINPHIRLQLEPRLRPGQAPQTSCCGRMRASCRPRRGQMRQWARLRARPMPPR